MNPIALVRLDPEPAVMTQPFNPTRSMTQVRCSFIAVTMMLSCTSMAMAQMPRPIQRLGRLHGVGWGDGYHACQSSGVRPLADLPARSQVRAKGGPLMTFYDQFDAANSKAKGSCSGCSSCDFGGCNCDDAPTWSPSDRSVTGTKTIVNGSTVAVVPNTQMKPSPQQPNQSKSDFTSLASGKQTTLRIQSHRAKSKMVLRPSTTKTPHSISPSYPVVRAKKATSMTMPKVVKSKPEPAKAAVAPRKPSAPKVTSGNQPIKIRMKPTLTIKKEAPTPKIPSYARNVSPAIQAKPKSSELEIHVTESRSGRTEPTRTKPSRLGSANPKSPSGPMSMPLKIRPASTSPAVLGGAIPTQNPFINKQSKATKPQFSQAGLATKSWPSFLPKSPTKLGGGAIGGHSPPTMPAITVTGVSTGSSSSPQGVITQPR